MKRTWIKWDDAQDGLLAELWPSDQPVHAFVDRFPGRSVASLVQRALSLELGERPKSSRKHLSESRIDGLIREALKLRPMDAVELAAKTGASRNCVEARIRRMFAAREIHISAWERFSSNGYPARVWALGNGKDAKRPAAKTAAEKWRKRMHNLKTNRPDEYMRVMARRKHQYRERAGLVVRRDPLVAAFFGSASA